VTDVGQMTDTLRGLRYMHELKPNPIIHGDIKSVSLHLHSILASTLSLKSAQYSGNSRRESPHMRFWQVENAT
jgi:serine/threonine protein kinase